MRGPEGPGSFVSRSSATPRDPHKNCGRIALKQQKLRLHLRNNRLTCERLNRDGGPSGFEYHWKIRETSNVPNELFFLILGYVRRARTQCATKSFADVRRAIKRALYEAARACCCQARRRVEGGSITWYLDGAPFIAFQIHRNSVNKKRVKKLLRGNATLRWVITLVDNGFMEFVPQRAKTLSHSF